MLLRCCLCSLFFCWLYSLHAQKPDIIIRKNLDRIDIPFDYENNFIIVNVTLNNIFPLRFIFDTGAEHTILTQREITDLLQVNYSRKLSLLGADLSEQLFAYVAHGVSLNINGVLASNRTILVLEEDYINFQEFAGINVNGIIGSDLFRRFVVRINYKKRIISLFNPSSFKAPGKNFTRIPLLIDKYKPHVTAITAISPNNPQSLKLLIDTGASLALLLYTNTNQKLSLPQHTLKSRLGMGMGGFIEGFLGRISSVTMDKLLIPNVITNFQDIPSSADTLWIQNRNGIIGNQILNRFHLIIDYPNAMLYLQPNTNLNKAFDSEKSGLTITASGKNLDQFTVHDIVPDSPADIAGIKPGDLILSVNGFSATFHSLEQLTNKFYQKVGKKMNLVIIRNGSKFKTSFALREML
jgi:predicted aspartyl protease